MDSLQFHVIGGPIGESIVVGLPDSSWGVVDCYASSAEPEENPTIQFLRARSVTSLRFIALTHPHHDHFFGMSHLVDAFATQEFWHFPILTHGLLKQLLDYEVIDAEISRNQERKRSAAELKRLFAKVDRLNRNGDLSVQLLDLGKEVYEDASLRIRAISPSGDRTAEYARRLGACFNTNGTFKEHLEFSAHNIISSALMFEYGQTRVVLGGDVESDGWKDSLARYSGNLGAHAVKVSHHGSTTGYSDQLWPELSKGTAPIAVITPFRRFHLPKKEAIEHISRYAQSIVLTFTEHAIEAGIPLNPLAHPRSRECVAAMFKATPVRLSQSGAYSMHFDSSGNCIHEELDGSAARL